MRNLSVTSRNLCLYGAAILLLSGAALSAETTAKTKQAEKPAKVENSIWLVDDSVVAGQWPHLPDLVNAPTPQRSVNPGACLRAAILVTGEDRDAVLAKTRLAFHVEFAGKRQDFAMAAFAATRRIKPEGGDFLAYALEAASIANPMPSMASMGVSAERWCVPEDAADGRATFTAEADSPAGPVALSAVSAAIESFATGAKRAIKNDDEFSELSTHYYRQPNPARLVPMLDYLAAMAQKSKDQGGVLEIGAAFLVAALKDHPIAARDFLSRLGSEPPLARALGMLVAKTAGYDADPLLKALGPEEQTRLQSMHALDDPYDLALTQKLFGHLDLMWANFGATGQFKPIQTIASMLAWKSDYEEFDKARKQPNPHLSLTPSVIRAVTYMAAGWSMGSFQKSDPLVADYIAALRADVATNPTEKQVLKDLLSNPAFKRSN